MNLAKNFIELAQAVWLLKRLLKFGSKNYI